MKFPFACLLLALLPVAPAFGAESPAASKPETVILDAVGVQNLRIETAMAEPGSFEETVFALGRIEVYPGRKAAISSRIPGRALEVLIKHDHPVQKGDVAVIVESRQFGDPPPVVELKAPISGLVSATFVVPGEPVNPDKVLAEIVDLTEVYALARVPEHLAARLKPGQMARITAPAVAGKAFRAKLEHLGTFADEESGTVEAAFHVENPALSLRPGMRAEFSIVVAERSGVMSIPREALQGGPADRFVYVKDFELPHAFIKTPVVVGTSNEQRVEIVRGLLPADEVVTKGAYSLAFAGPGNVSLKEALDAAHGHEHNADGSEVSASKGGSPEVAAQGRQHGHGHHAGEEHGHATSRFWMIMSGVLLALLIIVSLKKRRRTTGLAEPRRAPEGN